MNKQDIIKEQYRDGKNLTARSKLHQKHSTNPQGFFSWLLAQYRFPEQAKILELGCGTGSQWETGLTSLPQGCTLVLSDDSPGMVDIVRQKFSETSNVEVAEIDIQSIPYPDETFDVMIANHMLYHVPDLPLGLSEVRRVLKPDGLFYAATNASDMQNCLRKLLRDFSPAIDAFPKEQSFSLDNGKTQLDPYFSKVTLNIYEDSLDITETSDLMDWLYSACSMGGYTPEQLTGAYDYFEALRQESGCIHIPKRTGLFTAVK